MFVTDRTIRPKICCVCPTCENLQFAIEPRSTPERFSKDNIEKRDRRGTGSFMVCSLNNAANDLTPLKVLEIGTVAASLYLADVLKLHVQLFRTVVGDNFLFTDGNAPCHRTSSVKVCVECDGINHIMCLARSPDLNPIKIV